MDCHFCKRKLKTAASLKTHQKTAKYCLILRGKIKKGLHICTFCAKDFSQKVHLNNHMKVCESVLENVSELKEKVKILEQKIQILEQAKRDWIQEKNELNKKHEDLTQTLAIQPRYTQHNRINIIQNLAIFNKTDDDIQRIVHENYNIDHLIDGQKGVARFTNENIIKQQPGGKPIYVITDKIRGNGKYRVSNSEMVIDNGMIGLSDKVIPSMRKKAAVIYRDDFDNEEVQNGYNELIQDDMTDFRSEMIKLQSSDTILI